MVERTPVLDAFAHLILIAGAALVCIPIYFVFVTGTLTQQQVLQVPMPWVPGDQFMANVATAWQKADFGRLFLNSLVVSAGIVVGKIALSLLAAFAVTYFRFPFRMTAFWLIFVSLMLPIEVRIVPTYEAAANAALPWNAIVDALDLQGLARTITGRELTLTLVLPIEVRIVPTYEAAANAALPWNAIVDALDLQGLARTITGRELTLTL